MMKLRGCSNSHFILAIKDGMVKKVLNVDSHGRPGLKFKKLEDICEDTDAGYASKLQDGYDGIKLNGSGTGNESTRLPFAERKTRARNGYIIEEDEPECPSNENNFDELTLSQIKKKFKRKKRKAPGPILLTPKEEVDDSDLSEPLCKFRAKVSKSPKPKKRPANGSFPTSRRTQSVTPELGTSADGNLLLCKDIAFVNVKVETPEMEHFERREITHMAADPFVCNEPARFIASECGFVLVNNEPESGSFRKEDICASNEVSLDNMDNLKNTFPVPPMGGENMELDHEENMPNVLPLPSSEMNRELYVYPPSSIVNTSNCSQSQPYLQHTPEQVNYVSGVQDSNSPIDVDYCVDLDNQEHGALRLMPDYLCLPWKSNSWSNPDDDDDDMFSVDVKSPISEKKQHLTSVSSEADSNSLNSDNNSFVLEDTSVLQEQPSFVSANTDITSETLEIRNSQCTEPRHSERLPLTRKAISPTSQEKLCLAMKSSKLLDDMDHYKCKEKLFFGEQVENRFLSTKSDVEDNEANVHPQQANKNKVVMSPKCMLKKPKNFRKGSPPKRGIPSKGCLDGPRLCRSLPRLSTGCTSIQGCSESAIAFSQRQMHDIESLASKLMSELNSMKVIVEEKLLFEAYRSPSLKNEPDEVKSAIKSATKTEETARKWLSMMARDCNRFCKIMKLNEDSSATSSGSGDGGSNEEEEKGVGRERKKISFADEAGGELCEVKVFEIDEEYSLL